MSKDPFDLTGKQAVVTGGGSGIGKAIAIRFATRGARIMIFDFDQKSGEETASGIRERGDDATFVSCDVADRQSVERAYAQALGDRPLHILVNNAGVAHIGNIAQTEEADLDRVYQVNVKGVFNCAKTAIPRMSGGGVILNMASVASVVAVADRFAYSMSKGAVLTMTLSIAKDYLERGIRCNCIAPARIHTPFVDGFLAKNYPGQEQEMFERLSKTQPIGRMGTPEEVAALALYLCSDEAAFITGACYPVDGGFISLNS